MSFEPGWITAIVATVVAITTLAGWVWRNHSTSSTALEIATANRKKIENFVSKEDIQKDIADAAMLVRKDLELWGMQRFVDKTMYEQSMDKMYAKFDNLSDKIDQILNRFIDYSPPPQKRIPLPKRPRGNTP